MDSKAENHKEFIALLTSSQNSMYTFIFALTGDSHGSRDILQKTNIALWEKADEYDFKKPFISWAFAFAKNQIRAEKLRQRREILIYNDEMLDIAVGRIHEFSEQFSEKLESLPACIKKLSPKQQELINHRYGEDKSVNKIAEILGQSTNTVTVTLFRIRSYLKDCIESGLRKERSV